MTTVAELIVLAVTKVGETSAVVHTLSRKFGRRGFLIHIGRKAPSTLFQPLNILEADIVENRKSSLWSLKNPVLKDPLNGIRGDLRKSSISLFMSEVLYRTVRDGANEEGLYDWAVRSILTLDAIDTDFANFHIRFLLELAGALGFSPSFEDIAPFAEKQLFQIRPFLTASFTESMLLPLTGNERNALCESLIHYLEYHTESPIHIKSLPVLRELYQ